MKLMIDNDGIIYLSKGTKLIKQICPYNSQQFISGEGKSGGYSGEFAGWQNQTTKYVDIPCNQSCPKCKEPLQLSEGKYSFKVCGEEYIIDEFVDNREKLKCDKCWRYTPMDDLEKVVFGNDFGKKVCKSCYNIYYRQK